MRFLLALIFASFSFAANTTITDTIKSPFAGGRWNGTVTILCPHTVSLEGASIAGEQYIVNVTNGAFTVVIAPYDSASPSVTCNAGYRGSNGQTWNEYWLVPTSGATLKISNVLQPGPTTGVGLWQLLPRRGDLATTDGITPARLPVGADGSVPIADSSQPLGLRWSNAPNTTGNAATATALATLPTQCAAGSYTTGVNVLGTAQGCTPLAPSATTDTTNATNIGAGTLAAARTAPSIPGWLRYSVVKIANGTNGCANGNGCWQLNGVRGANASATLTQDITLVSSFPANGIIDAGPVLKTSTACTGPTTASVIVANPGGPLFSDGYDLKLAVSATNYLVQSLGYRKGPFTSGSIVATLTTTGANVDQVGAGCAVDVWLRWSVLP